MVQGTSWISGALVDGKFYPRKVHATELRADLAAARASREVIGGRPVVGVYRKHSETTHRFPSGRAFIAALRKSA